MKKLAYLVAFLLLFSVQGCLAECTWSLPNLSLAERYGLVNLATFMPSIILDIRYATANNFMGFPLYPKAACYLHKDVAEVLNGVQHDLAIMHLNLKVFDGYRPLSVQQKMWDTIHDDRYVANPQVNKGRHTRGTAVDLTLVDCDGNELEMPTPFDDFSEKAHSNYPEVTETALKNRSLLRDVMARHHFKQVDNEWWHFDFDGWEDDVRFPPLDISLDGLD